MAEGIRIRDLGNPNYSEAGAAAIKAIDEMLFEFSLDSIVAAARAECDVPFFTDQVEDDGTLDRLDEYLKAVEKDQLQSRLGRFQTTQYAKRHLIQRSRLEALYTEHPEIDEIEIKQPLIIAGLPRSGTTHLINLIGADQRLRSLRYWESLEPIPSPAARRGEVPDERRKNGQAQLDIQNMMMPLFRNMYDVENDGIHEEIELQHMCMSTLLMAASAQIDDWLRTYFERDQRPYYAFLKRAIKALQFLEPRERWVLKSPQHMSFVPTLLETFPDATLVITHRDPVAVFTSWATMLTYAGRFTRSRVDVQSTAAYARLLMKLQLDGLVRDKALIPESQTEHVYFHEFMADDWGTLARIYERAEISFTDETRASMTQYIDDHPRGRHGKILYDLEEDFGIDRESVYADFENYLSAFPNIRRETPNQ